MVRTVVTYEEVLDELVDIQDRENTFGLPSVFRIVYTNKLERLKVAMAKEIGCEITAVGLLSLKTSFLSVGVIKAFDDLILWTDAQFQVVKSD